MKRLCILSLLLIPIFFVGCQTVNQQDRAVLRAHNVSQDVYDKMLYGDPLTLDDIVELSHRAVPPGLIIHYVDETDTVYRLRKVDVKHLRAAGVDEQVISCMLFSARPYGQYAGPGPYPYTGPYAYPYPYDPYFYGAFGPEIFIGGYGGYGGHGRWGHGGWGHHHH